jgi:transposase-like protein
MEKKKFKRLLKEIDLLTSQQRQVVQAVLNRSESKNEVAQAINQQEVNACPHCGSTHLQKWGWKNDLQRWRCKACRATFNRLTGTHLARLRKKSQWLKVVQSLNEQETLSEMQTRLNISRNTAVLWRRRFLSALKDPKQKQLSGIVEADETFVRQSEKGCRVTSRTPRKRAEAASHSGTHPDDYMCVYTARDRSKTTAHQITNDQSTPAFKAFLKPLVAPDSILCSDGKTGYAWFTRDENIQHVVLNGKKREFIKAGVYHLQNVNAYHSRLKGFLRRLKGVATRNLEYYITWLDHIESISAKDDASLPLNILKSRLLYI